ncbi:MAG: hypothetical protein MSS69_11150 [Spirochaetales bacterium]|nr:hypothetical protein [Spirochaetales bacterium]
MKKKILIVALVLMCSLSLWAGIDTILSVKTYYTGNNIPTSGLYYNDDDGKEFYDWNNVEDPRFYNSLDNDWWMKRQDYWMNAYDKTSFLDLGFEARLDNFLLVTRMDIMQDVLVNLQDPSSLSTNLPFVGNLIDLSLPRLGFVEWTSENGNFFISLGRRLIKWGPGTYDLTIADSQPYLDNIWTEFRLPLKNDWNFNFNYIIISPKMWMDYNKVGDNHDVQKTIFAHKWSFYNNNFRITIAELNNIYGKDPNFLDASPLIIWHDSNQDDYSNVFLHLILEGKVGPVRAFGGFAMDDFDLPHEKHSAKPMAMGFSAGIEYHVFDGEEIGDAKFDRRDYTLKEDTFKVENGLNIGAEWYYLTPLMYNRNTEHNGAGKFTIPFQFVSLAGSGYVYYNDAYYLGFKYGPDSNLFRFYAEYTDAPFEASLAIEYLTRGQYGIESKYGDREAIDSHMDSLVALAGNKTSVLIIDADFRYYLQEAFKLDAGLEWQQDITHNKSAYKITLGASINPLDVDWNNLF